MQRQVHEWTGQYTPQYWPAQQILSRLAEEVGEVARNINHLHGFKKKKADEASAALGEELVDVVFTIACMAGAHGISMAESYMDGASSSDPYALMAQLIQHQGEMARIVLRNDTHALSDSIAAMLQTTNALAVLHNIDLQREFNRVMQEKHYGRDANRFEKKSA